MSEFKLPSNAKTKEAVTAAAVAEGPLALQETATGSTTVPTKKRNSGLSRILRVSKISFGRIVHSLSMRFRLSQRNGQWWTRFRSAIGKLFAIKRRRSAAIGGIVLAACVVFLVVKERTTQIPYTVEPTPIVLDEVKVFPPNQGNTQLESGVGKRTGIGRRKSHSSLGGDGRRTEDHVPGPAFPRLPDRGVSEPMPSIPRAAWLTGTIEETDRPASAVRPASYAELPFTHHGGGLLETPQVLRRYR